jgi:hypothetical protein
MDTATTSIERLDSCDCWGKSTAAERAVGAIDISEEHHDIVRLSAGSRTGVGRFGPHTIPVRLKSGKKEQGG